MTVFNADSTGYKDGKGYPLYHGPALGVLDTINVQYPELEELYQQQISQIWNEFEVDLAQDRRDMLKVPEHIRETMVRTIMWQTVADSVASRSITEVFGAHASNSELASLLTVWEMFEVIHARTYGHIIKQTFVEPNLMLERIYTDADVLARSAVVLEVFDTLSGRDQVTIDQLYLGHVALFALEQIAFMASFAVTFAVAETGVFQGISKLVQLVCRDELLHAQMGFKILRALHKDTSQSTALAVETKAILDAVLAQELQWAETALNDTALPELNTMLLQTFVKFQAGPAYSLLGLPVPEDTPSENPLPYIEKYLSAGTQIQEAAQEIQLASYQIGAIQDDTSDLTFD